MASYSLVWYYKHVNDIPPQKIGSRVDSIRGKPVLILFFLILLLQAFQLQYSSLTIVSDILNLNVFGMIESVLILYLIHVFFRIFLFRWKISIPFVSILITIWSIINYYVIQYHGSPLFGSEIRNAKTALAVADGYDFSPTAQVVILVLLFLIEALLMIIMLLLSKSRKFCYSPGIKQQGHFSGKQTGVSIRTALLLCIPAVAIVFLLLFSPVAFKPRNSMKWTWVNSVKEYGYLSCIIEDIDKIIHKFNKPDGYNENAVNMILDEIGTQETNYSPFHDIQQAQYPDIILILNETFYDFDAITTIETDHDYLKEYYNIPNARYGQCVVPNLGGGTNNTEYELLTGNSMALLGTDAPFNYIDFVKDKNNIVQNLESSGYTTLGMHCGGAINYARKRAYPEMGFDTVMLGKNDFTYFSKYGNRRWTDADNYRDLLEMYDKMGEGPRFVWLLTYQNHAYYEQNDPEYDTVHVLSVPGNSSTEGSAILYDKINEYLTCLEMSAKAIHAMTVQLQDSERDVIVCMLGDHAPVLVKEISAEKARTEEERELLSRTVPWMLWSNNKKLLSDTANSETADNSIMSTFYMAPTLFQLAGIPEPEYYQIMLKTKEKIPVCTGDGIYMNPSGQIGHLEENEINNKLMQQYYYMEYYMLTK